MLATVPKPLYEQDFNLWLEETIQLLETGRLDQLDAERLIEELKGMGASQRQALASNLRVVLLHLLKWKYQPTKRSRSGSASIIEHSTRLLEALADSPSLKHHLGEIFLKNYLVARKSAAAETGLALAVFPEAPPFGLEDVLNPDYRPLAEGEERRDSGIN
ncbi:MAG: DUF29 family protein [Cyanobacteria bacterium RI_101]|nr:DUF29 family protein [Cyanobacteria bacterium RI_101]